MSKSNNNYKKKTGKRDYKRGSRDGSNERKQKDFSKKSDYANEYVGEENGPEWYNVLRTLIKDVTMIPFNTQVGTRAPYINSSGLPNHPNYINDAVPGVLALRYLTIPGIATTASDGVNIAATGLFQKIRKGLSTVANYASADVMMYVLGEDGLIITYNTILRAFGVLPVYSSLNYNYNSTLFAAMGLTEADIADFKANYSVYRARFNNLIYKASTIYMPSGVSIIDRHAWLFSNYFIDADSPKAQIYVHVPEAHWVIDETISENGTALRPVRVDTTKKRWIPAMLDIFESQIEAFRNSDSLNKIAADMKRSLELNSWTLPYCDEQYVVGPTYSKEVLSQIENTTILPEIDFDDPNVASSFDILQSVDKNIIEFDPIWKVSTGTLLGDAVGGVNLQAWHDQNLINMHWNNPSSDDIAVATRNMVNFEKEPFVGPGGANYVQLSQTGSDICVGMELLKFTTRDGISKTPMTRFNWMVNDDSVTALNNFLYPDTLKDYVSFDWAPIIYIGQQVTKSGEYNLVYEMSALCDYDNYTFIDPDTLSRIHNNIIASMWSVPQLGDVTA